MGNVVALSHLSTPVILNQGGICSPVGIRTCLETFLAIINWEKEGGMTGVYWIEARVAVNHPTGTGPPHDRMSAVLGGALFPAPSGLCFERIDIRLS